jgi:hypothetical protein
MSDLKFIDSLFRAILIWRHGSLDAALAMPRAATPQGRAHNWHPTDLYFALYSEQRGLQVDQVIANELHAMPEAVRTKIGVDSILTAMGAEFGDGVFTYRTHRDALGTIFSMAVATPAKAKFAFASLADALAAGKAADARAAAAAS